MSDNPQDFIFDAATGAMGATTALMCGMKLAGAIAWSWWWVFSPVMIYVALFVVVAIIAAKAMRE